MLQPLLTVLNQKIIQQRCVKFVMMDFTLELMSCVTNVNPTARHVLTVLPVLHVCLTTIYLQENV